MARNINELLKVESFSEMTDEEIAIVIEYRAKVIADSEEAKAREKALTDRHNELLEEANKTRNIMMETFNNAISAAAEFKAV